MHEESRQGLKRLHLLRFEETLREAETEQARRGLISKGFQQVQILRGERLWRQPVIQGHDPEELLASDERHTITALCFPKIVGICCFQCLRFAI